MQNIYGHEVKSIFQTKPPKQHVLWHNQLLITYDILRSQLTPTEHPKIDSSSCCHKNFALKLPSGYGNNNKKL